MLEIFMTKGAVAAGVVGAISLILTASGIIANNSPVVTISDGELQGRWAYSRDGNKYLEFLGIPFAEPPVGELRFEAPLPLQKPWTGVKQCTQYPPICLQLDSMVKGRLFGVEDCLYLNVFSYDVTPVTKKPVLVYIHGGGFSSGSSSMYGPKFIMDEDIVLVTMNYRLGPLGFLSTGNDLIRGNMGLKDQNLALQWVKRNIEQFGGDASRVTLFGESAGAASVQYHMVSPLSQGLFQRAIAQSGAVTCPWSFTNIPRDVALNYINELNLPTRNMTEVVHHLKTMDIRDLVKIQINLMDPLKEFSMFVPTAETVVADDTFLTENPRDLLRSGRFARIPLMMGVVSGEGALRTARFEAMPELIAKMDEGWFQIAPQILCFNQTDQKTEVANQIRNYYFGKSNFSSDSHDFMKNFSNLNSDGLFFEPIHRAAMLHASQGPPTYLYYYDYDSVVLPSMYSLFRGVRPDDWLLSEIKLAAAIVVDWLKENVFGSEGPHDFGATHADDLFQLWNMEGLTAFFSGSDYEFSRNFVRVIVNFARAEIVSVLYNSRSPLEFNGVSWPPIQSISLEDGSATSLQYMLLGKEGKLIDEPFADRVRFWESLRIRDAD